MIQLRRPPQPVLSSRNVGHSLSEKGQKFSRNRERSAINCPTALAHDFEPEALSLRIRCALEAPLLGAPAFRLR